MKPHAYRFFFSSPINPNEVVEIARSPLHSAMRAGLDHGTVVFDSIDALGRLEFQVGGLMATLSTKSQYAREMVEIVEEAAHGRIIVASDILRGNPITAAELPVSFRLPNTLGSLGAKLRRSVKRRFNIELNQAGEEVLVKVASIIQARGRTTFEEFTSDELCVIADLQELGLVSVEHWHFIQLADGLIGDE